MKEKRQLIPAAALVATIALTGYMVVQLNGQTAPQPGNFTSAAVAEVRNAQGLVILSGQFRVADEDDKDIERKAVLAPTDGDADATGKAEVEFDKGTPTEQEVEFSVRNVPAGAALTFVIDGTEVGGATADARGRAEIDIRVPMSGSAASR